MSSPKILTPKIKRTLDLISESSGLKRFFIQDTETTGIDLNSEIYEFAGIMYDGTKTGAARYQNIHYYLRPNQITLNELKRQGASMQKNPWEHAISDEDLEILEQGGRLPGNDGKFISSADFVQELRYIETVPNITYNAVFDINQELRYMGADHVFQADVYDAATMVIDIFPQIVYLTEGEYADKGRWKLEKIYHYLSTPGRLKKMGINKPFSSYGGTTLRKSNITTQQHTAMSDVRDMLIPVMGVIADLFKQHKDWNFKNFKNQQYSYIPTFKDGKKLSEADYLKAIEERNAQMAKAGMKSLLVPWKELENGYKQGYIASGNKAIKQILKEGTSLTTMLSKVPASTKSGQIHKDRFGLMDAQRSKMLKDLSSELYGKGSLNTVQLLKQINNGLEKYFTCKYVYNPQTGTVRIYLLSNEPKYTMSSMNEVPSIRVNLARPDGSINLYTKNGAYKGINAMFSDYRNGKTVVYTAEQVQLLAICDAINKGYIGKDPQKTAYTLNREIRKSMESAEALQDFVTGDTKEELSHNMSGVGSKIQTRVRLGFLRNERFIVNLFKEHENEYIEAFWKGSSRASKLGNKEDCRDYILQDLNDIVNQLGTLGLKEGKKIIDREPRYNYLRKMPNLWGELIKIIGSGLGKLKFTPGSAGENSVGHMSVSLTSPELLNIFGASRQDRRHSVQSSNSRLPGTQSTKMRQESRNPAITETLLRAGVRPSDLDQAVKAIGFATTSDYTKAYLEVKKRRMSQGMSESEFIKQYGSPHRGLHSGGSMFAAGSAFEKQFLQGTNEKSVVIEKEDVYKWLFQHRKQYFVLSDAGLPMLDNDGFYLTNPKYNKMIDRWWEEAARAVGHIPAGSDISHSNEVGSTQWRVHYFTDRPMNGAGKLVVGGFDERTVGAGINAEIFKQILKDKGLSTDINLLMNPDDGEFSSKNIGGLLGAYMNAILVHTKKIIGHKAQNSKQKKYEAVEMLDKYDALKGIYYFDPKIDSFVIRDGAWNNAIKNKGLTKIFRALNDLGKKVLSGPAFELDAQKMQWKVTNYYVGYTTINQAATTDWGDPEDYPENKVVAFDYRARQAGARMLSIAGFNQKDVLYKTLIEGMSPTKKSMAEFKKVKEDVYNSIKESQRTAQEGFSAESLTDYVRVGWGKGSSTDVDLSDVAFSTDVRTNGKFDEEKYAASVYGAIERAKTEKAKQLKRENKNVRPEDVGVYIDLQGTFTDVKKYAGNSSINANAVRYLFIPNFTKLGKNKDDIHYGDMPSYEKEFNTLLRNIRRYNELQQGYYSEKELGAAKANIGTAAFNFQYTTLNDIEHKDGSTYQRYNKIRTSHSLAGEAVASNYLVSATKQFSALDRKISSVSGLLGWEDMYTLISNDEVRGKKGKTAEKAMEGHITVLTETLRDLWSGQEAQIPVSLKKFAKAYLGDKSDAIQRLMEKQHAEEARLRDKWSVEGNTQEQINRKMRRFKEECAAEKERVLNDLLQGLSQITDNIMSDDTLSWLKKPNDATDKLLLAVFGLQPDQPVDKKMYRLANDLLSAFIVESVTLGSDILGQRSESNQMKGMSAVFMRFPLSNGLDIQFTDFYVDSGVAKGKIIIGQGTGHEVHLDYDGDHPPMWLPFLDSENLGKDPKIIKKRLQQIHQDYQKLKNLNQQMRSGLTMLDTAMFETNEVGYIKENTQEEYGDFGLQVKSILAGRKYKGDVGRLSNTYQAVVNAYYQQKLDEVGMRSSNKQSQIRAIKAMVVRAFFETLTQDSISSKKVFDRLKKTPNIPGFLYSLEDLLDTIRSALTYNSSIELGALFKKLGDMGLLGIEDRIMFNVMSVAQAVDPSGKVIDAVFGKGAADQFLVEYKDGEAVAWGRGENRIEAQDYQKIRERLKGEGPSSLKGHWSENFIKKIIEQADKEIKGLAKSMVSSKNRTAMTEASAAFPGVAIRGQDIKILNPEAQQKILQLERQLMKDERDRQGLISDIQLKTGGTYTATAFKTLKDFKANKNYYGMFSIQTGLDTSHGQHRTYIVKEGLTDKEFKELDKLDKYSVTQIASALHIGSYNSGNLIPLEYGTLFHGLIEAIYNGDVKLDSEGNIDSQSVKAWIESMWKDGDSSDKATVIAAIYSDPTDPDVVWNVSPDVLATICEKGNNLIEQLRVQYSTDEEFRKQLSVVSEQTHGIVLKMGNKNVVISGTIDQIWYAYDATEEKIDSLKQISDIKTSKYAYLEYVIQLSLYGAILRAAEEKANEQGGISNQALLTLNSRLGKGNGLVKVDLLPENQLLQFVEEAIGILEMPDSPEKQIKILELARKWNPQLTQQLTLEAQLLPIDDQGAMGLFVGGSSLSTILDAKKGEMPYTALEERLWDQYSVYKTGGDPIASKGFDYFVNAITKKPSSGFTRADYDAHVRFRAARGQFLSDYISRIKDDKQRTEAIKGLYKIATSASTEERDISVDFILRTGLYKGAHAKKVANDIQKADISTFYSEGISGSTYNLERLFPSTEEDDDVAKTEELIDALMTTLSSFKNGGNGGVGHAKASNSSASSPVIDGATQDDVVDLQKYANYKKEHELLKLELYKYGEDSTDASYLNKKSRIEELERKMGDESFVALRKKYGEETWDKAVETRVEKDEKYKQKLEEKQNELLEKRVELLEKIDKLEAQINVKTERSNVSQAEILRKQKEQLQNQVKAIEAAGYGDGGSGAGAGDMIRAREEDAARASALKRYRSLTLERGRIDASIRDLTLTHRTTYDKLYRTSIEQNIEDTMVQREYTEQEIKQITDQYLNDPEFQKQMEIVDKEVSIKNAVRNSRVDVKHKGRDTLWGQLGSQLTNMLTRFTQMGAAYKIIGNVRQGLNTVIQSAKNLDKALTDLRIVTGKTGDEARNTMGDFAKLAGQLGVTTTEVASAGTAWLRQGYDMAQVTDLITSSMYLARLGMISVDEATKGLTSTLKGFKLEASEAMDVVDKLTALDVKAATTAGEIATGLAQFANLANLSGINTDQAAAMVATIADVSQVSGAQAGNSLKMMLSRYGNVKSGKFDAMDGEGDTEALNDVEKVLNKIGISMRDANSKFREFDEVLEDISEKWSNLDNISRNAVASAVAGTRQREAFLVLMENMDKYHDFTKISESSEGTAYKKYLSYQEQLEASQKRLSAAWEELAQNSDVQQFLTDWNNFITNLVKTLPLILKYGSRIISAWSAYRIPSIFKGVGRFLGLSGPRGFTETFRQTGIKGFIAGYNDRHINGDDSQGIFSRLTTYGRQQLDYERLITAEKEKQLKLSQGESVDSAQQATESKAEVIDKENVAKAGQEELAAKRSASQYQLAGNGLSPKTDFWARAKNNLFNSATFLTIAASTLTSILTAGGTNYNFAKQDGSTTEASSEAKTVQKVTSGAATALAGVIGGAMGGPFGAMIGTTIGGFVGDALNPLIGGWIDVERDLRNQRVEEAQEQLKQLKEIRESVSNLEDSVVNSTVQTYEEYMNQKDRLNEMKLSFAENPQASIAITERLKGQTYGGVSIKESKNIYDIFERFSSFSPEEQERFLEDFTIAGNRVQVSTTKNSLENSLYNNAQKFKEAGQTYVGATFSWDPGQVGAQQLYDAYAKEAFSYFGGSYVEKYSPGIGGGIKIHDVPNEELYKFNLDFYTKAAQGAFGELGGEDARKGILAEFKRKHVDAISSAVTEQASLAAQMDTPQVAASIGETVLATPWGNTKLSKMNDRQLRSLKKADVLSAVTQQIVATGGLEGYKDPYSLEAQSFIEAQLKTNPDLYPLWSGENRTLGEAIREKDLDLLQNFANTLGLSIKEVKRLDDSLQDMSLGQIIELTSSLEKARGYMEEIIDLSSSLASEGFNMKNVESIVKQFPELTKYTGNLEVFYSKLLSKLGGANTLYNSTLRTELLTNDNLFNTYIKSLSTKKQGANLSTADQFMKFFGNEKDANGALLTLMGMSYKDAAKMYDGLTEEAFKELKKQFNNIYTATYENKQYDATYNLAIEYQTKLLDKQLENLNAQKEALQNINKQREYENKLVEAQLKLSDAAEQKKRVWREGVGWVYESDQGALAEAEKNVAEVENEQEINLLDMQISELSALKDDLSRISELLEFHQLEDIFNSFVGYFGGSLKTGTAGLIQTLANLKNGRPYTVGYNPRNGKAIVAYAPKGTTTVNAQQAVSSRKTEVAELKSQLSGNYKYDMSDFTKTTGGTKSEEYLIAANNYRAAMKLSLMAVQRGDFEEAKYQDDMAKSYKLQMNSLARQYERKEDTPPPSDDDIQKMSLWDQLVAYRYAAKYWSSKGDTAKSSQYLVKYRNSINAYKDMVTTLENLGEKNIRSQLTEEQRQILELDANTAGFGSYAKGTFSFLGGPAWVNENGTEAVITPQGTLTALPSETGIVPADITKNVWQLGELAPSILRALGYPNINNTNIGGSSNINNSDSLNIGTINMNVSADDTFDGEKFIQTLKQQASLNRNTRR